MPRPTIAPTLAPFTPAPLDLPTSELLEEVGGTWFEVWIPQGARHGRVSPHEIVVHYTGLVMAIQLAHDVSVEREFESWRRSGALVLRREQLADGFLVTSLGDRCLDVVRLARHPKATVRCHVHVVLARLAGWQAQSYAEALCASLQIR